MKIKFKYSVDFKELKKVLSMPTMRGTFKEGDIIELVDEKTGISRKCKVKNITNTDDNPHVKKLHFLPSPFEYIEIDTEKGKK